ACRRAWVVDPLDGTKEFVQHIPEFCVCVSLVEAGRPVVAVSYNPAADRLYVAERGCGTTVNGVPAHVSRTVRVPDAVVLASRSEDRRGEWDAFKGRVHVQLTGSVAFKLAELSTGAGDATFTLTPKNEWDICAGTLLVEEAGGKVTDLAGAPLRFNEPKTLRPGMIASNGVLHDGLLAVIVSVERERLLTEAEPPEHGGGPCREVGHDRVDAERQKALHLGLLVDRPDVYLEAEDVGGGDGRGRHDRRVPERGRDL